MRRITLSLILCLSAGLAFGQIQRTTSGDICPGNTESYVTLGAPWLSYSWSVGSGGYISGSSTNMAVNVVWTTAGSHQLSVNVSGTTHNYTETVLSAPDGGLVNGLNSVCYNTSPGSLSVTGGSTGTYQWGEVVGGNFQTISGATGSTYDPGALTSAKVFQRKVTNSCGDGYSDEFTVSIYTQTSPGTIGADQTIISGSTPANLGFSTAPTGGNPSSYSYQWQINPDQAGWSDVSGATGSNYQPPVLTEDTEYRVKVTSGTCPDVYTNSVAIDIFSYGNKNYVLSTVSKVEGITDPTQIPFLTSTDVSRSIEFYDGLGRNEQSIQIGASPTGYDIVQVFEYDGFGRAVNEYLPYTSSTQTMGSFVTAALTEQGSYYTTTYGEPGFAPKDIEASPLNRVMEQGAPGTDWQLGNNTIKLSYELNASSDNVVDWDLSGALPSNSGTYATGELSKNTTEDEQGNQVIEFTDRMGQTILKRVQAGLNVWADTYYLYDDFGNLSFVFPPELSDSLQSNLSPTQQSLNTWAFQYKYDHRNRMIEKKVPGAGWVYLVYDLRDRLVLTQDANQRAQNEWLFTKYDELNRPVITGILDSLSNIDRDSMDVVVYRHYYPTDTIPVIPVWGESYEGSTGDIFGYSNTSFPTAITESSILTVTYYDKYDFVTDISPEFGTDYEYENNHLALPAEENLLIRGQVTGSLTQYYDVSTKYLSTVTYYDDKYRVIQIAAENILGEVDKTSNILDFAGQVLTTKSSHASTSTYTDVYREFDYDNMGRLNEVTHDMGTPVKWQKLLNSEVIGGDLVRTTGTGWNAGGSSVDVLEAGKDGWVQYEVTNGGDKIMFGFDVSDPNGHYNTIDYAIHATFASKLRVYENGVLRGDTVSTYKIGDILRVERVGNTIHYKKNGKVVYTSGIASNNDLVVDVAIANGTVSNHSYSFGSKTNLLINTYNELGELVEKNLHDGFQSIDFTYNIRGWLTKINDADLSDQEDDLFGMELFYNVVDSDLSNTGMYNGNISGMKWNVNSNPYETGYTFSYDALNRIKNADHRRTRFVSTVLGWYDDDEFDLDQIGYDLNGNIDYLKRRADDPASYMDDLSYDYVGNQLQYVTDAGDDLKGFKDGNTSGNDFEYDANGNLVIDRNKGIDEIQYNHLNLPTKVIKDDGQYIQYVYDAAGIKLSQQLLSSEVVYNSDFSTSNTDGWFISQTVATSNVDAIGGEDDVLSAYTTTSSIFHRVSLRMPSMVGHTVNIKMKAYIPGANTNVDGLMLRLNNNGNVSQNFIPQSDTWVDMEIEGYVDTYDILHVYLTKAGGLNYTGAGSSTDDLVYIKDVEITLLNSKLKVTDYIGEFIYEDGIPQFANHEEGRIILSEPNADATWNYTSSAENWTYTNINNFFHNDGFIKGDLTATGAYITSQDNLGVDITDAEYIQIRLQNKTDATSAKFTFITNAETTYDFGKELSFPIVEDSGFKTYTINTSTLSTWSGTLKQLRLYVAEGESSGRFNIDFIRVIDKVGNEYQYHIKDHLGNVRVTFTTQPETTTYQATMESENAVEEAPYFGNITTQRVAFNSANSTPGGNEVVRVNGANPVAGTMILAVAAGDTLDLSVTAYHEGGNGYNNGSSSTFLINSFVSAFMGMSTTVLTESQLSAEFSNGLSGLGFFGTTSEQYVPKAYINYVLFDANMKMYDGGFQRVSSAANWAQETLSISDIRVEKGGYAYIWLSEESNVSTWVYFDDLTITHTESPIIQSDDYYPFGLTFNSWQRSGELGNDYLYNGKERQDELDIGWMDYGARMYDGSIGRFMVQDRFSEKYLDNNPYHYTLNNPILYVDINGDSVDVSGLTGRDRRALKRDLSSKTGMKLKVRDGMLLTKTNSKGQVKMNNSKVTSSKARETLKGWIGDTESTMLVSSGSDGNINIDGTNKVQLDRNRLKLNIGETSEGLDPTTMGWALIFFHEGFHTVMGGGTRDPEGALEGRKTGGENVARVNEIRAELNEAGGYYGQRNQYSGSKNDFGTGSVSFVNPRLKPTKRDMRRIKRGKQFKMRYKYKQ